MSTYSTQSRASIHLSKSLMANKAGRYEQNFLSKLQGLPILRVYGLYAFLELSGFGGGIRLAQSAAETK